MRFKDVKIGQWFDWINPERPMSTTFYRRCVKISERKYRDETGFVHRVGSIEVKVFHVDQTME